MFRNYFKTAWRNIVRNKTFSFINIFGLSICMSVCLLIILIISDQNGYDAFFANKDRVYRIHTQYTKGDMNPTASPLCHWQMSFATGSVSLAISPFALLPMMKQQLYNFYRILEGK